MQSEEQQVIDGLFSRLKEAEAQSAPRDVQAEALIGEHIGRQPAAPYYMAQVILIQEAGLKRLDQRVRELEAQLEQAQRQRPAQGGGGFLAGLFGAGSSRPAAPSAEARGWNEPGARSSAVPPGSPPPGNFGQAYAQAQAPSRGSGFLGGALQTAAGVAGGMVLGNMLTGLFQHSQPQEIVEIIKEEPATDSAQPQDYAASDNADYSGGNDLPSDAGYQDAGLDDSGGGFFDDDDSFI